MKPKNINPPAPDPATFASVMGQAAWLMTLSKDHRDLPISVIEDVISPAVLLQQFKVYLKRKQPVAFLSWAAVSDEVKARFEAGTQKLEPQAWRSGTNIVVVDCVSPFADRSEIEAKFLSESLREAMK